MSETRIENDIAAVVASTFGTKIAVGPAIALAGDASGRRYFRIPVAGDGAPAATLVAMVLPGSSLQSDEKTGDIKPAELPFLDVQRLLHSRQLPVVQLHGHDLQRGVLLLEDLGDETFEARLSTLPPSEHEALYGRAVDLLARIHAACAEAGTSDSIAFKRHFSPDLLRWELSHFVAWGLEAQGCPVSPLQRALMAVRFDAWVARIGELPTGFVHRDFQSRNLMLDDSDNLRIIDFQDALVGPAVYDLVALLCDSYVALDGALQGRLIARYANARGQDVAGVEQAFWLVAAQRKLKDAGRFVFIDRVRGNPTFLRWFPQSLVYVDRALVVLEEWDLRALLAEQFAGYPDGVATPSSAPGTMPNDGR